MGLVPFEPHGTSLASAHAERGETSAGLAAFEFMQTGEDDAGSADTDRMPEGNGSAIWVEEIVRQTAERLRHRQSLCREGFIEFDDFGIGNGTAGSGDGVHWSEPHAAGVASGVGVTFDAAQRFQSKRLGAFLAHDQQSDGSVADLRGIAGGDGSAFLFKDG